MGAVKKLRALSFLIVATLAISLTIPAYAQEVDLKMLMEKIDKLEKENQVLKSQLNEVKTAVSAMKGAQAAAPAVQTPAVLAPVTDKAPVTSQYPIKVYGYVKADMIYNDSQIGELAMTAPMEGANNDDDEFFFTARESRIGLDFTGPEIMEGKTLAKIEADFWGSTTDSDTAPGFRLRQAYIDLKYPNWDILAGQTWDFFAPLNPSTLNFAILWRSGNMGDRHPQVRLTSKFNDIAGGTLTTQVGALETTDMEIDTGIPPVLAGYAYYENKVYDMPYYIGAGAIYGRSRICMTAPQVVTKNVDIWAATMAFKFTPIKQVTFSGEGYVGQCLAAFRAGSTVDTLVGDNDTGKAVVTHGGWAQVSWQALEKLQVNGGMGLDKPHTKPSDTIQSNENIWDYNYSFFANAKYEIIKNLYWGVEYQFFRTKYWIANDGGEANRIQTSLIFNF